MNLIPAEYLGRHLAYTTTLFRMETLPAYAVTSDGDDFLRWQAGELEPSWDRKNRWLDVLRAEEAAGKDRRRVRVLTPGLTEYERYACEWGYAHNAAAGEDIRVLRAGEHVVGDAAKLDDFWIVDDGTVVEMHYDAFGRFLHGEESPSTVWVQYLRLRDAAWDRAEPFLSWWARHPELHRNVAV